VAAISAVFTLNNLVAFTLWTTAGDWLARTFGRKEHAGYLNAFFGGILAMVGFWMLGS
jgi:threonine/homoserine/homoserine lactone efflux protein